MRLKQSSTLGETLKKEVGVHSSYYGPNSSSPIIRGLDGARVLVSQNGLDVGDASRIGADHVVSAETSTASQIEGRSLEPRPSWAAYERKPSLSIGPPAFK